MTEDWLMSSLDAVSPGAAGQDTESVGRGRFMDGRIWMPCPHSIGDLPRPS